MFGIKVIMNIFLFKLYSSFFSIFYDDKNCFNYILILLLFFKSVTLHTDVGDIKIEVFCEECPKTAEVSLKNSRFNFSNIVITYNIILCLEFLGTLR